MVKSLKNIKALLLLVRLPNLLIIALTQVLIKLCIIDTFLELGTFHSQFAGLPFISLVLATVFISAGGYAINDYFDRKTDRINKPDAIIVGRLIHPRHVMAFHLIITFVGLIIGIYASFASGLAYLSLIFLIVSGLLWFYSTTYKRQLLLGNFVVATLTALVPYIVLLFEMPLLLREYGEAAKDVIINLNTWVLGFSTFAFLINFSRELVKDAEDYNGDVETGRLTVPVVAGINVTRGIVIFINLIVVAFLLLAYVFFIPDKWTLGYFIVFIIFPLLVNCFMVWKATNTKSFHKVSLLLKFIMLAGIFYIVLVNILLKSFL